MSRVDLAKISDIGDGQPLTKALEELVQCGFIRKYKNYTTQKQGDIFQIIDPFVLFCLKCVEAENISSWETYCNSPGYYSWRGNAFEILCLNHIKEIKENVSYVVIWLM